MSMLVRLFAVAIAVSLWFVHPVASWAASPFAGQAPDNIGLHEKKLADCPSSPNCVVSQGEDLDHYIDPIHYSGDRQTVYKTLLDVISVIPRTEITESTPNYIRTESHSRLLGFVDDLEFYFPDDENIIHLRSAARVGESDLGVNRRRLEQIRLALQDLGA